MTEFCVGALIRKNFACINFEDYVITSIFLSDKQLLHYTVHKIPNHCIFTYVFHWRKLQNEPFMSN